jgi:hypothetical protein
MLEDIRNFADLQAVLALATDPTLVTVEDEDGEFIIVSVDIDITSTDNTDNTEVGLVPYSDPVDLPDDPISRTEAIRVHLLIAKAQPATKRKSLKKVTTYKKPPNGG